MAVPRPQHSAMFGQRASSQIVCSPAPWISFLTSKYWPSCDGARTFIHSGRRGRSATGNEFCHLRQSRDVNAICVFCGASSGRLTAYADAARALGERRSPGAASASSTAAAASA